MAKLDIQEIHSMEDPDLQPYLTLRRPFEHHQKRIFVAEGDKVVRRHLESPLGVLSILITRPLLDQLEPLLQARPEPFIRVYVAEKELIENLTGFSFYQGILSVGQLPPPLELETVLEQSAPPRLLVAFDALANAENLGVLIRNCTGFGVQGIIMGETSTSPYLRRAVRSSMGTIFKMPVFESPHLVKTLHDLRARGILCIAAHPEPGGKTIAQTDFTGDCCIIFGNEGTGITQPVLDACDEIVAIPMGKGVDSLNVGNAGAVFLYEANRQRGQM